MLLYEKRNDDINVFEMQNFDFIAHVHHNIEVLVCLDGTLDVTCSSCQKSLNRGDMMIAFSNDIHSYSSASQGKGIIILVNPSILPAISATLSDRKYENYISDCGNTFLDLTKSILHEYNTDCCHEIIVGYLYILFGTAFKKLSFSPDKDSLNSDLFSTMLEYISEHYTEDISLKLLSKKFYIDVCHISRMFTSRLSCGFLTYIHELRVEHAKTLLHHSELSISNIMYKSGFSHQKTFNRVFKQFTNQTPREYRRSIKAAT